MSFRKIIALALCVAAFTLSSAHAQSKIALVDMKKLFEGYYKTMQAGLQVADTLAESEKTLKGMLEEYEKGGEEYKKLLDSANDQAVNADERAKRKTSAEKKLLEIQEIEKSVTQFRRTTQVNINERNKRMRDEIVKQIRDIVAQKAKAGSYNLVFDSSGESFNQTPVVLYSEGASDLTKEILTELNSKISPDQLADLQKKTEAMNSAKK
ncbi:MAG TPA: OmpH family outer membrane protein [Methylomirabilota bacterium]|nr:OmpH family outer membrane protein [Methylomirabilota bacterium]